MKLVLVRHGESEWNKLNLFTGWSDVELSSDGHQEAIQAGNMLKEEGYRFDICYTSYLKRAIQTLNHILDEMDQSYLPIVKTWKLNERHYGALQGLNKAETAQRYGEDQVKLWRRSYDVLPPQLREDDSRNPKNQIMYEKIASKDLPSAESLKTTIERVIPYFEKTIKQDMQSGKQVLIVAHGNSIRALVKYFDDLNEQEIMGVNIPTGIPLVYEFDDDFQVKSHDYLGDAKEREARIAAVANQGNIEKQE